jgi:hypothetical protein
MSKRKACVVEVREQIAFAKLDCSLTADHGYMMLHQEDELEDVNMLSWDLKGVGKGTLALYSRDDLKEIARKRGITGYSSLNHGPLVALICNWKKSLGAANSGYSNSSSSSSSNHARYDEDEEVRTFITSELLDLFAYCCLHQIGCSLTADHGYMMLDQHVT